MEKPAEMGGRSPGERAAASSFSATCRRLSRYLKEKGSFGEVSLGMAVAVPRRVEAKPETLRTLNLLPGVEASPGGDDDAPAADRDAASDHPVVLFPRRPVVPDPNREQKTALMTIFYGGRVVVFNNFPADKARELMDMAGRVCPPPSQTPPLEQLAAAPVALAEHQPSAAAAAAAVVPTSETKRAAAAAVASAADAAAPTAVAKQEEAPNKTPPPATSDLPIARRVSLHRFLEKRKDRITAKAPYQVNTPSGATGSSSSPPAKGEEDGQQWLGLAPQASKLEGGSAGGWRQTAKPAATLGCDWS